MLMLMLLMMIMLLLLLLLLMLMLTMMMLLLMMMMMERGRTTACMVCTAAPEKILFGYGKTCWEHDFFPCTKLNKRYFEVFARVSMLIKKFLKKLRTFFHANILRKFCQIFWKHNFLEIFIGLWTVWVFTYIKWNTRFLWN